MPEIKILPSILAADIGRLEEGCRKAEKSGADALHVDIMDGHFVHNLSMGPGVVSMARKAVRIPLSVHLMCTHPEWLADAFLDAGSDPLLIHVEANCDPVPVLRHIRKRGARAGITLNPETPAEAVIPLLPEVDEVLFMSVHPGFGGQDFIENVLPKIAAVRRKAPELELSVDGGINHESAEACAAHGANVFIAGTFLFKAKDMAAEIAEMRRRAKAVYSSKVR
jgi:ribulose-phosphate 3-epimerase